MKRNIKRLVILVIVPVMALFTVCVISSSGKSIPHGIKGHFAVRGTCFCWYALGGFDVHTGVAKDKWAGGPSIFEGEYTFSSDGTGTASGDVRALELASPLAGDQPSVWSGTFSYTFTYTVDDAGNITFTNDPNTFIIEKPGGPFHYEASGTSNGVMSIDGKTIMITFGPPSIWIQMIQGGDGQWHPSGPQQACVLSLNLTKLR